MHLGIRCIIALSIERIHAANLLNFGILPLYFADASELDKVEQGDSIELKGIGEQLRRGSDVVGEVVKTDGSRVSLRLRHLLSSEDIELVLRGGRLV